MIVWAGIIVFGVVVPVFLILLGAGKAGPQSMFALSVGAVAFSLMGINLFLATRPRIVESLAGGLDRVYHMHKWVGIAVFPLVIMHEGIGMDLEGQIVASGLAKTAVDIAEIVFPILLVLLAISAIKRIPILKRELIPYHFWRWSHRVMGLLFIALFLHQLFVKVPFNGNAFAAQYLNAIGLLGIASFIYTQFLAPFRPRRYRVTNVEKHAAATIVTAEPTRRGIKAKPGAFAVISFGRRGLREPHPFTISGTGENGKIEFSIRALGDFTAKVRERLEIGDKMTVEGPYGRFDYRRGPQSQLWLAGGIGVTPFLAFADSLDENVDKSIELVYCVNKEEEAVGLDRLRAAEARCPGFKTTLHVSKRDGRLTAEKIAEYVKLDLSKAGMWFCGPAPMRAAVTAGLKSIKKMPRSLHFEKFEFR